MTFNLRIEVSELSFVRIAPWSIKNRLGSSVSSRSLLITYLVTLCQEKETIVLERKSEKSLEFWTPNLHEP